jgi:PTH1 family peptidyl-tRNA hydrolase
MTSIVGEMGNVCFPRIRVGIGPLPSGVEATDFVLSSFLDGELPLLEQGLAKARNALGLILDDKIDLAMNLHNQRLQSGPES